MLMLPPTALPASLRMLLVPPPDARPAEPERRTVRRRATIMRHRDAVGVRHGVRSEPDPQPETR